METKELKYQKFVVPSRGAFNIKQSRSSLKVYQLRFHREILLYDLLNTIGHKLRSSDSEDFVVCCLPKT